MSFSLTQEPFSERFTRVSIRHNETENEVVIIPESGARFNHFLVNLHGEVIDIIDGYSTPAECEQEAYSKGSLLAPFPNRVAEGIYYFHGKEHQLSINDTHKHHAIHGLVSQKVFSVESHGQVDDYYELVLRYVSEGEEGYPFPYAVTVRYRFGGVWLEVDTELENTGKTQMPAGFGWQPYFHIGGKVDGLRLTLPEVERLELDDRLIPTGRKGLFKEFTAAHPIGATEFDMGFKMVGEEREVQLFDEARGLFINLTFPETDARFEYLQVHTLPSRRSISIAPMTCASNAFNNQMGLRVLSPGESLRSHFTILVS